MKRQNLRAADFRTFPTRKYLQVFNWLDITFLRLQKMFWHLRMIFGRTKITWKIDISSHIIPFSLNMLENLVNARSREKREFAAWLQMKLSLICPAGYLTLFLLIGLHQSVSSIIIVHWLDLSGYLHFCFIFIGSIQVGEVLSVIHQLFNGKHPTPFKPRLIFLCFYPNN